MSLVCASGYGLSAGVCVICPSGTYSTGGVSSCIPVPTGFYNPYNGQSSYSLACTTSLFEGAASCEQVPAIGFTGCTKGYYYNSSVAICLPAPTEYYSPSEDSGLYYYCSNSIRTGAAACLQSNSTCVAGQVYDGTACSTVPASFYNPDAGSGVYYWCSHSHYPGAASCNTADVTCAAYSASNTNFAITNFSVCDIYACPGTTIIASGCGAGNGDTSSNDQYLNLMNSSNLLVEHNDDYCGSASQLSYAVGGLACQLFTLREGCYLNATCFGSVNVTGGANCRKGQYYDGTYCTDAPSGYYVPESSSGVYYYCQYSIRAGAANCEQPAHQCGLGKFYNTSLSSCQYPPEGYINPIADANIYYYCSNYLTDTDHSYCLTAFPTATPTYTPTSASPTVPPSARPTRIPTTASPTFDPTSLPTEHPTAAPTDAPTTEPTSTPTSQPTRPPSPSPSVVPSIAPTVLPTTEPSASPTSEPTVVPSSFPSCSPTTTPTTLPSAEPTSVPSVEPTTSPTVEPTSSPTSEPTVTPTVVPSVLPTVEPSTDPSPLPTTVPTCEPTVLPSAVPSVFPTAEPTPEPTAEPTVAPTVLPTPVPTVEPTVIPSTDPSPFPTAFPSPDPTVFPTSNPSADPSSTPTSFPTCSPTAEPSAEPTSEPTELPTAVPTFTPTASPTPVPTVSPSPAPSAVPSVAPTYDPVIRVNDVPVCIISSTIASSTSVTVNIQFSPVIAAGGSVLCAAFKAGATLRSLYAFSNQGVSISYFDPFAVTSQFNITALNPLTSYDVYCYAKNKFGLMTSFSDVVSNKATFETLCCKTIALTTMISSFRASSSSGEFVYSLSDIPSNSITVSLSAINSLDSTAEYDISIAPKSITFYSKNIGIFQGKFIIVPSALVSGYYSFNWTITGPSASEYSSLDTSVVHILSSSAPLDAPILVSAIFSDEGTYIEVTFDSSIAINVSMSRDVYACDSIFVFPGASEASCILSSARTIQILFTKSSQRLDGLATPGSVLSILGGVVASLDLVTGFEGAVNYIPASTNTSIDAPRNPIQPKAILSVNTYHCICDDLVFDYTNSVGNAGRFWSSIRWTVFSTKNATLAEFYAGYLSNATNVTSTDAKVVVPANLLQSSNIYVVLTVTNFLGSSASTSVNIFIDSQCNQPIVKIAGSEVVYLQASQFLSVYVAAQMPSCAEQGKLRFYWDLNSTSVAVNDILPISLNPRRYLLAPFSLRSGYDYVLTAVVLTTSSSSEDVYSTSVDVTVVVLPGNVVARVTGGHQRSISVHTNVSIDASSSYDSDTLMNSNLNISWFCSVTSQNLNYGSDCASILLQSADKWIITVIGNLMEVNSTYSITATLWDAVDVSRVDSVSISVIAVDVSNVKVNLIQSASSYTISGKFVLDCLLSGSSDVLSSWSVRSSNQLLNITAYVNTPESQILYSNELANTIAYPLSILYPQELFQPGVSYTFVLTACTLSTGQCIYSQADIDFHAAPIGGSLISDRYSGYALSNSFGLSSSGWFSLDVESYPFQYSFGFRKLTDSPVLLLSGNTLSNRLTTILPEGSAASDYAIVVIGYVTDVLQASVNSAATVYVYPNTSTSYITYLDRLRVTYNNAADADELYQQVNSLSVTISAVNCTLAPNCTELRRKACGVVVNTCGSCESDALIGVFGPSNTECLEPENVFHNNSIGSPCSADSDCLLGYCNSAQICATLLQTCPTAVPDQVCSGHGACAFVDSSKKIHANCSVLDVNCRAICLCNESYGGSDCSLDPDQASEADQLRASMCDLLLNSTMQQDSSTIQIDSLIQSLMFIFNPYEIFRVESLNKCVSVFEFIVSLSKEGYLVAPSSYSTISTVKSLISLIDLFTKANVVNMTSIQTITNSISDMLVEGEFPIEMTTDSLRISIQSLRYNSAKALVLSPPLSPVEAYLGKPSQNIEFGPDGFGSSCRSDNTSNYLSLSVSNWGINPYSNSSAISSNLLQFQSISSTSSSSSSVQNSAGLNLSAANVAYFVVLQYLSEYHLNVSLFTRVQANRTIPECSQYDSSTDSYRNCGYCNISTYTDTNVTYACYDIQQLCGAAAVASSVGRRLDELGESGITSYGVLLTSIAAELSEVLSINPFTINLARAKVVLIFVGLLTFWILLGVLIFLLWDRHDHNSEAYMKHERAESLEMRMKRLEAYTAKHKRVPSPNDVIFRAYSINDTKEFEETQIDDEDLLQNLHKLGSTLNNRFVRKINNFFNRAIPPSIFLDTYAGIFSRFVYLLSVFHPYVCMFDHPSCLTTRTMRWLSLCRGILISLFVDTVFFGVFYPTGGVCSGFHDEAECLSRPSQIVAGETMCTWDSAMGQCALRPPPSNLTFIVVVALLCTMTTVPIDMVVGSLMDDYAALRPRLEAWGLSSDYWLGRAKEDLHEDHSTSRLRGGAASSPLSSFAKAVSYANSVGSGEADAAKESTSKPEKHQIHHQHHQLPQLSSSVDNKHRKELWKDQAGNSLTIYDNLRSESRAFRSLLCNKYYDLSSPMEEVQFILKEIKSFWLDNAKNPHTVLDEKQSAKALAMIETLKVYPDGTPIAMSVCDRILYGNYLSKMQRTITRVRNQADNIVEEMKYMNRLDFADNIDIFLIQYFVLEQVGHVPKFALAKQFFTLEGLAPFAVDPALWLLSWIAVVLSFVFLLYWILAWGVVNEGVTLKNWGINFALGVGQDFTATQPIKILVLHVFTIEAARPQLKNIHTRLIHVATMLLRPGHSDAVDEFSVIQRTSASCRAARMTFVCDFPAAYILRNLNDLDIRSCRDSKHRSYGALFFVFIVIPALIGLFSDLIVDGTLEVVLPSVVSAIIIVHYALYNASPALIVLPYATIIGILFYRFGILKPAIQRINRNADKRKLKLLLRYRWRYSRANIMQQSNKRFHRMKRGCMRYACSKIATKLLDQFSLFVASISGPLFSLYLNKKFQRNPQQNLDRETRVKRSWMNMNLPTTLVPEDIRTSDVKLPESISLMLLDDISNMTVKNVQRSIDKYINSKVFAVSSQNRYWRTLLNDREEYSVPLDTHVYTFRRSKVDRYAITAQDKAISALRSEHIMTTDTEVALERLYARVGALAHVMDLPSYAEAIQNHALVAHSDTASFLRVPDFALADYCTALRQLWRSFAPGGYTLTKEEVDETIAQLCDWNYLLELEQQQSNRNNINCRNTSYNNSNSRKEMISIVDFRDWFYIACEDIISVKRAVLCHQLRSSSEQDSDAEDHQQRADWDHQNEDARSNISSIAGD